MRKTKPHFTVFDFRKVRKPKTCDRERESLERRWGEREKLLSLLFRRLNKQLCSATNRSHFTEQMPASLHVLISKSRPQIHTEIRFFRVKTSIIVYLQYYINYSRNILLICEVGVMAFFRDSGQR